MDGHARAQPTSPKPELPGKRLHSWKEIARYLNRHVTTVRRWEKKEGLPVHRHLHGQLGSVYAYANEIDAWFEGRRRDQATLEDSQPYRAFGTDLLAPRPGLFHRSFIRARAIYVAAALLLTIAAFLAWSGIATRAVDRPHGASGAPLTSAASIAVLPFTDLSVQRDPQYFSDGQATLAARMSSPAATIHPGAYEHFLRAQFFFQRRQPGDFERAKALYLRALDLEPGLARAWAGLAGVYYVVSHEPTQLEQFGLSREAALEKQREAAEKALGFDPNLAEAHIRRADFRMETGDRAAALQELKDAERLDPNSPLVLGRMAGRAFHRGRPDEAVDLQRRVVIRDPLALAPRQTLGLFLFGAGRFDEARAELETVLHIAGSPVAPDEFPHGIRAAAAFDLARALMAERRFDDALLQIESWPNGPFRDHGLALARQGLGNEAGAYAALQRLLKMAGPDHTHLIAEIYAFRGDAKQAFTWLATASEQARRSDDRYQPWALDVRYSPFFASLHGDPRWKAWLAENSGRRD